MAAGKYNFSIEQGTTVDFEISYTDSNDNPIDLSGYTARLDIRPLAGSDVKYLTLSSSLRPCGTGLNMSGSGGLSASKPLSSGSIGVYISHVSSSALSFSDAVYDLELVSGSGDCATVERLLEGSVSLHKEVTKGSY
jgi:hypothetical protein